MTRRDTRPRMSVSQHLILSQTDDDGRLTTTDQRIIGGLIRRGWAQENVQSRGKRRRPLRWWTITDAGRAALASDPVVVTHKRVLWRGHWNCVEVVPRQRYVAEDHGLVRPGSQMLWRVRCPSITPAKPGMAGADVVTTIDALDFDEDAMPPVAFADTLSEAVELLAEHLLDFRRACAPRRPHPQPTDLDTLT